MTNKPSRTLHPPHKKNPLPPPNPSWLQPADQTQEPIRGWVPQSFKNNSWQARMTAGGGLFKHLFKWDKKRFSALDCVRIHLCWRCLQESLHVHGGDLNTSSEDASFNIVSTLKMLATHKHMGVFTPPVNEDWDLCILSVCLQCTQPD